MGCALVSFLRHARGMHAAVALVAQQPCSVDDRQEQVTPTNLQAKRQEAPFLFGYEEKVPGQASILCETYHVFTSTEVSEAGDQRYNPGEREEAELCVSRRPRPTLPSLTLTICLEIIVQ